MSDNRYMLTKQILKHKDIPTLGMQILHKDMTSGAYRVVYIDLGLDEHQQSKEHNLVVSDDALFSTWMGPVHVGNTFEYILLSEIGKTHTFVIVQQGRGLLK